MRTSVNLALQLSAVMACIVLRLLSPGWVLLVYFVLVPIGTAALVTQVVTAAIATRWPRISAAAAVLSVSTAVCLLGWSLLAIDGGDGESGMRRPVDLLLGTHVGPWADTAGFVTLLGWLGGVVATAVVVPATRPQPPRVWYPVPPNPYARRS
jgi:hypothetical protein